MSKRLSLSLLLALISLTYLYTAAGGAIFDDGDALYSHIAQQMAKNGDWVTPYANGVRFLDKPPMMYWLMALSYRVLGCNEFAARLPAALAVLGISVLMFLMGKRAGGASAGFTAGMAVALCIGTFLFTRQAFPDVIFVFFLTLAIFAFHEWYLNERNPLLPALLFYASLAGAVLTKSLIGLVFPVAIIMIFLIAARDLRRVLHLHILKGSLLFICLALPWHILAARRNPGFLWYFFVNEQFLRFMGKRQPVDYESISLPVFWALVLLWLFPWSAFLPAIRHLFRKFSWQELRTRCTIWLCAIWAVVVLAFFSVSSRIEHYSMPIFPPLALLLAVALSPERLLDQHVDQRRQRSIAHSFAFLGLLGGILGVLVGVLEIWLGGIFSGQSLSNVAGSRLHAYRYYFAPLFEMPPETLDRLKTPLIGTCAMLAIGLLGAWWINRRGKRMTALLVLSLMLMTFCFFTFQSLRICEEILSSRQFGQKLNAMYRPGDSAIVVGDYETANSLNFYSPFPLDVYGGTAAVLQWGLRYPDAPARILTKAALEEKWNSSQRTFLLAPNSQIKSLGLINTYIVMQSAGRTLLSNQPGD